MPVIDDVRDSRSHVKGKGFKYAFKYYKDYYLVPTIIALVVGLVLFSIIRSVVTAKDVVFSVAMINATMSPDSDAFGERLGLDLKEYETQFDTGFTMNLSESTSQTTYVNAQKIMAMVAASSLDALLGDPAVVEHYFAQEFLADLRTILPEETLERFEDKTIWYTPVDEETGEEGEPFPIAIDIGDAPGLTSVPCFFTESQYFAIVVNTLHPDYCNEFLNWIYE